ncbi:MAG: hypothetical protein ACFFFC_00635 [Candidatus Thorarchaeota archaeon]
MWQNIFIDLTIEDNRSLDLRGLSWPVIQKILRESRLIKYYIRRGKNGKLKALPSWELN